jgi:hypothetical protein
VCEQLGLEERARFDFQYLRANTAAKELTERREKLFLIPISQPDAIPKKMSARIGIVQPFTLLEFVVLPWRYG